MGLGCRKRGKKERMREVFNGEIEIRGGKMNRVMINTKRGREGRRGEVYINM